MDSREMFGEFWQPSAEADSPRVAGNLSVIAGSKARLELRSRLVEESARKVSFGQHEIAITESGDPADRVADFVPRTFLGDTGSGHVTCVDAYLQSPDEKEDVFSTPPLRQLWDIQMLILGGHFPEGKSTSVEAVSFSLGPSAWWGHLPDERSVLGDFGTLRCTRLPNGQVLFEVESAESMTVSTAERAVQSIITLVNLAVGQRLAPSSVQIRARNTDEWAKVHTRNTDVTSPRMHPSEFLLPPRSLSLERMAKWLNTERTMDGLSTAVAEPIGEAAIQVKTLTACSLVEGIHRRIIGGKSTYKKRAAHLFECATRIAQEIVEPINDWPHHMKEARNSLAHHNPNNSLDLQIYDWILAESSAIWVLRVSLLSHAGFADGEISSALNGYQKYRFYRENLKMHHKERAEIEARESVRKAYPRH